MPKERNGLSFEARTKLTMWISNNKTTLENNTDEETAKIAATSLKCTVTAFNVKSLRQVIFPKLERKPDVQKKIHPGSPFAQMIAQLFGENKILKEEIAGLKARMSSLENELGVGR